MILNDKYVASALLLELAISSLNITLEELFAMIKIIEPMSK